MKFRCEKIHIQEAVNTVMKAVSAKSTIPILEGILLKVKGSVLTLIGNDLSISIETVIPVVSDEDGEVVIEAKKLFEMIRKLPNDTILFEVDSRLNTTISSQNSKYQTMALSAEEFPAVNLVSKEKSISLPSDTLKSMIRSTLFAVAFNESSRQVLNGTLFEVEGNELHLVSLDGYRLAIRKEEIAAEDNFQFIVPGKTLSELNKILPEAEDKVEISFSRKYALFTFQNTKLVTRLIEGEFFNYKKSIPTEKRIAISLPIAEIRESVERVDPIISASEFQKNPIKLCISNNTIEIDCQTSTGVVHDSIDIDPCGEELTIGFNHKFLQDAIRACEGEEIVMEFNSANSPCLLKPVEGNSFLYLVLPVKLNA